MRIGFNMNRAMVALWLCAALSALVLPQCKAILRGDETQKLHDETGRLRQQLSTLDEDSAEHQKLKAEYHAMQHKLRALQFFEHGMTQSEYDEFVALVDRKHELFAAHSRDSFDHDERLEFAQVTKKVDDILKKYKIKKKEKRLQESSDDEDRIRIRDLRKKMSDSEDRDESEVSCRRGLCNPRGCTSSHTPLILCFCSFSLPAVASPAVGTNICGTYISICCASHNAMYHAMYRAQIVHE